MPVRAGKDPPTWASLTPRNRAPHQVHHGWNNLGGALQSACAITVRQLASKTHQNLEMGPYPRDSPLWEEPVRKLRPDDVRDLRDEVRDLRDDVRELRDEVRDMRDDVRELRDNDVRQCRWRDWRRRMASHVSSPWLSG